MKTLILIASTALLVAACDKPAATTGETSKKLERQQDFSQVSRGARIFQNNCAQCHGSEGQGDANWRQRNANGFFPPPPLNGSGHAWHHPKPWLKTIIANGSFDGSGRMPAWKSKLSEQDIEDVIAWFQSRWSDEVYAAWAEIDLRSRK